MTQEDKITLRLGTNNALERVSEIVHSRLVDCGWRDRVRLACRKAIAENGDKVPNADDLIKTVTAQARPMIPDSVKKELLHELEKIIVNVEKVPH